MQKTRLALLAVLVLLAACNKEEAPSNAPAIGVVGEDGRYDCADSTVSPQELAQWDWLQRGFRLSGPKADFSEGSFRVRFVRREPSGPELLVQLERIGGKSTTRLIRPRTNLHQEFVAASMEKGLIAGLWTPKTPLDTLLLPDTASQSAFALFETKGLSGWATMRRCDTATHEPSPLSEALYIVEIEGHRRHSLHALRPGHYADPFWNQLQKLIDGQETFSQGVGF